MRHARWLRVTAPVAGGLVCAALLCLTLTGCLGQPSDGSDPVPTGDPSIPTPTHASTSAADAEVNQTGTPR